MKKLYDDPSIDVSLFEEDNVIALSGEVTKTVDAAAASFFTNELGSNPTIINFLKN